LARTSRDLAATHGPSSAARRTARLRPRRAYGEQYLAVRPARRRVAAAWVSALLDKGHDDEDDDNVADTHDAAWGQDRACSERAASQPQRVLCSRRLARGIVVHLPVVLYLRITFVYIWPSGRQVGFCCFGRALSGTTPTLMHHNAGDHHATENTTNYDELLSRTRREA
jgi:hypothetical protein